MESIDYVVGSAQESAVQQLLKNGVIVIILLVVIGVLASIYVTLSKKQKNIYQDKENGWTFKVTQNDLDNLRKTYDLTEDEKTEVEKLERKLPEETYVLYPDEIQTNEIFFYSNKRVKQVRINELRHYLHRSKI